MIQTFHISAGNPQTFFFQIFHGLYNVCHSCHRHIFNGTSRCFPNCCVQTNGTTFGNDNPMDTGTFCCTQNSAQIVRVSDTIQQQHKRIFPFFFCRSQNIFYFHIVMSRNQRNNALMIFCLGNFVQFLTAHFLNNNAFFYSHSNDPFNSTFHIAFCHHDFFNISAASEDFQNSISAFQLVFIDFSVHFPFFSGSMERLATFAFFTVSAAGSFFFPFPFVSSFFHGITSCFSLFSNTAKSRCAKSVHRLLFLFLYQFCHTQTE